jgi:uncharacterized OsmC-like protein
MPITLKFVTRMMMRDLNIINNVDLGKIAQTIDDGKKDVEILRKPIKLHGEWVLDAGADFQFKTELEFEKGKQTIEMDSPSFLGGHGSRLGPTNYCVLGIASYFALTFAILAARQGVYLRRLTIDAECVVNFAKYLDVADKPLVEGVKFRLGVESKGSDRKKILQLVKMAEERCPAVYMLTHKVRVQTELIP